MRDEIENIVPSVNKRFVVLAVGYFFTTLMISYLFYRTFSTFVPQDTAAYHQAIWNFVHGNGLRWSKFGGHVFELRISPFLYILTVPYALIESYFTLSAAYIIFFILGIYPFYRLIEQKYDKNTASAAFIAVAFHPAAYPALPQGFRVITFMMAPLAWMVYCYEVDRPVGYTLSALFAMSTHMLGVFLIVPLSFWFYIQNGTRNWRQLLPAVATTVWFIVFSKILFPISSFSHASQFPYGDSMRSNVIGALSHPIQTLEIMLNIKLAWVAAIVGALGFVPLLSSVVLATGFYIVIQLLRKRIYGVIHPLKQYAFPLFPFLLYGIYREADTTAALFQSTGDRVGGKLGGWLHGLGTPRRVLYLIAIISVISMLLSSFILFGAVSESDNRYSLDQPLVVSERDEAAWDLIHQIPSKEPVMATYIYHTALTQRTDLHQLPPVGKECWINNDPAYILLDTEVDWRPGPEISKKQMRILIESENTAVVDQKKGIVLLREKQSVDSYGDMRVNRDPCVGELTVI